MLRKDLNWRIGSGEDTSICGDRWLPHQFQGKPIVICLKTPPVQLVSDLVSGSRGVVDGTRTVRIWEIFQPIDVDVVLTTVHHRSEGLVATHGPGNQKKSELYSVKSVYWLLYNERQLQEEVNPHRLSGMCVHHRHIDPLANCELFGAEKE